MDPSNAMVVPFVAHNPPKHYPSQQPAARQRLYSVQIDRSLHHENAVASDPSIRALENYVATHKDRELEYLTKIEVLKHQHDQQMIDERLQNKQQMIDQRQQHEQQTSVLKQQHTDELHQRWVLLNAKFQECYEEQKKRLMKAHAEAQQAQRSSLEHEKNVAVERIQDMAAAELKIAKLEIEGVRQERDWTWANLSYKIDCKEKEHKEILHSLNQEKQLNASLNRSSSRLASALEDLRAENEERKGKAISDGQMLAQTTEELTATKKERDGSVIACEALKADLTSYKASTQDRLSACLSECQASKKERDRAKADIVQLQTRVSRLNQTITDLSTKLKSSEERNTALEAQKSKVEANISVEQSKVRDLRRENRELFATQMENTKREEAAQREHSKREEALLKGFDRLQTRMEATMVINWKLRVAKQLYSSIAARHTQELDDIHNNLANITRARTNPQKNLSSSAQPHGHASLPGSPRQITNVSSTAVADRSSSVDGQIAPIAIMRIEQAQEPVSRGGDKARARDPSAEANQTPTAPPPPTSPAKQSIVSKDGKHALPAKPYAAPAATRSTTGPSKGVSTGAGSTAARRSSPSRTLDRSEHDLKRKRGEIYDQRNVRRDYGRYRN